ncbi:hypothetical protein ACFXPR_18880 [Nocardia tengchongensis]|uniref:hypothetical protein n=1 Tax=Nocardia tengchongensis TaxID=2055889 RepID=UPI0036A9E719
MTSMQSEHEEAMRSDFREQAALQQRTYQSDVTESEIGECFSKAREIHGRWNDGPHADQWRYLSDAYADWRDAPDTMVRFIDNVEFNRAKGFGIDEVQYRSLLQARELTEPHRVRPRGQVQRER